ncbi:MAG: S41 family peptidase [Bacteroidaceae bacterium]
MINRSLKRGKGRMTTYVGLFFLLFLVGCGEDRTYEYYAITVNDRWIDTQMRNIYLWAEDIPKESSLDYFDDRISFFQSLLSTTCLNGKGDTYSFADTLNSVTNELTPELTYGFEFISYTPTASPNQRMARVSFVAHNSPAEEAGLKRGDWITTVDGENLSSSNLSSLYNGEGITVTTSTMKVNADGDTEFTTVGEHTLAAATEPEQNPLFKSAVFTKWNKKIAYLVYTHFETGVSYDAEDKTYTAALTSAMADFKAAGVTDFVLDLRYTNTGYLTVANQMAGLLAPASATGQVFCTLTYNATISNKNSSYLIREGGAVSENIDLSHLYILVSSDTAAAAEALISGLEPYMEVVLLGTKTKGVPVATTTITNPDDPLVLIHPVVAYVHNATGKDDYIDGISPTYLLDETQIAEAYYSLGDEQEYLLRNALSLITDGVLIDTVTATSTAAASPALTRVFTSGNGSGVNAKMSLQRKTIKGIPLGYE